MLTATATSVEELIATLFAIEKSLDTVEILDEAQALLLNRIRDRFLREVDPDNEPWPVSFSAIIRRAGGYTYKKGRRYTGTGTLFESGELFHSIQAYAIGPTESAIGTDVSYAKQVQEGDGGIMLPRMFLAFNEKEDLFLLERLVIKRLEESVA